MNSVVEFIAPYRFVRPADRIFYPSWGNQKGEDISFDMPYKDSQSGEIDIIIEAKSPIFVGNGKGRDSDTSTPQSFCKYGETYYIPGSSVRGMIRTIASILSFSKMSLDSKTLSYRDLNNPSYKQKAMGANEIYMGWLFLDSQLWHIEELGKITPESRISYSELGGIFGRDTARELQQIKEAYKKYERIKDKSKLQTQKGIIVFTGSTGNKGQEFLFPKSSGKIHQLSDELVKTFREAYYLNTPNESKDWLNRWGKAFKNGEKIPVFFQKNAQGIRHFGLSMLYKLPYNNAVDVLYKTHIKNHHENLLDCVERIFGFVKKESAIKGRVSFSHFKAVGIPQEMSPQSLILSSPRATFYPYYLQQSSYPLKTYDDKSARISGFKFYVPKEQIAKSAENPNEKIKSRIIPLQQGTKFEGKLRYFNLRREELGLMLLSLSFLNNEHFYKIGGAKPYGYGDCHITLKTELNIQAYIQSYIDFVQKEHSENPQTSISAKDLLEVSKKWSDDDVLEYMELKGFREVKREPRNKGSYGRNHHKSNKSTSNKGHKRDHGEKSYTDKHSNSLGNGVRFKGKER